MRSVTILPMNEEYITLNILLCEVNYGKPYMFILIIDFSPNKVKYHL